MRNKTQIAPKVPQANGVVGVSAGGIGGKPVSLLRRSTSLEFER